MDSLVANPTNPISDKAKADANNVMKELEKSYDFYSAATPEEQRPDPSSTNPPIARKMVPGEYSIHRLFAAISGKLGIVMPRIVDPFVTNKCDLCRRCLECSASERIMGART